jgi:hypothetical protein
MKNMIQMRNLTAIILMVMFIFSACKKDDPPPPTPPTPAATQITGTARLPVGLAGDLSNAKVSIYLTIDDWNFNNPVKFVAAQGTGPSVTFTIPVASGNYYLDVWKDVDATATWTIGDMLAGMVVEGGAQQIFHPFRLLMSRQLMLQ